MMTAAYEIGTRVGRAIAHDVLADSLSREWTGLDPVDCDQLVAAGIEPDTAAWTVAEATAKAAYLATLPANEDEEVDGKIAELAILTTTDNAGRHFTLWSKYWRKLEDDELIEIDRPIHGSTGTPYSQEYWSISVTENGLAAVESM